MLFDEDNLQGQEYSCQLTDLVNQGKLQSWEADYIYLFQNRILYPDSHGCETNEEFEKRLHDFIDNLIKQTNETSYNQGYEDYKNGVRY